MPAPTTGAGLFSETLKVGGERNYSYLYDKSRYASLWVAYPLCQSHTSGSGHTSSWRWNPNVEQDLQINVKSNAYGTNYNNSNYARGHQIPNADRKHNDDMNEQTFYLTNQTPQIQNGFNSGVWNSLETAVRGLLADTDTVYVVTGAAFNKVGETRTINYLTAASSDIKPSSVPIPNYYWKVLLKVKRTVGAITSASAIGVWFEHKVYSDAWTNYVVSVNQIETWTGFDFFANLPDSLENTAESQTSWTNFSNF